MAGVYMAVGAPLSQKFTKQPKIMNGDLEFCGKGTFSFSLTKYFTNNKKNMKNLLIYSDLLDLNNINYTGDRVASASCLNIHI